MDKVTEAMLDAGVRTYEKAMADDGLARPECIRLAFLAMSRAQSPVLQEEVERVALAIRDVSQGVGFDYMDFCRDAARAALDALSAPKDQHPHAASAV